MAGGISEQKKSTELVHPLNIGDVMLKFPSSKYNPSPPAFFLGRLVRRVESAQLVLEEAVVAVVREVMRRRPRDGAAAARLDGARAHGRRRSRGRYHSRHRRRCRRAGLVHLKAGPSY